MSTTASTLSNIGSDISVSLSFSLANEFINAAREEQLGDDELCAILISLVVTLTSLAGWLQTRVELSTREAKTRTEELALAEATARGLTELDKKSLVDSMIREYKASRGSLEFFTLMVSIAQRISLTITIQILSFSVRANQPSRVLRVVTLLASIVFWLFFESSVVRRVL